MFSREGAHCDPSCCKSTWSRSRQVCRAWPGSSSTRTAGPARNCKPGLRPDGAAEGSPASANRHPVISLRDVRQRYGKTVKRCAASPRWTVPRAHGGPHWPRRRQQIQSAAVAGGGRTCRAAQAGARAGRRHAHRHRRAVCPRIAYMPQGLGKTSPHAVGRRKPAVLCAPVRATARRERRRASMRLRTTGWRFLAGPRQSSSGMKQSSACAARLIHDPDLLIPDEPTTGVTTPVGARPVLGADRPHPRQRPADERVLVATAYMDEAQRFDWLVAMDDGARARLPRPRSCSRTGHGRWRRPSSPCCPRSKPARPPAGSCSAPLQTRDGRHRHRGQA